MNSCPRPSATGRFLLAAVLCGAALLAPRDAYAWSGQVHALICEMAWQQVQPATKQFIRKVGRTGADDVRSFSESCSWADDVRNSDYRGSYEYHFINVARGANRVEMSRDCPAFDCTPVAIHRNLRYLVEGGSGTRLVERRAAALRFLAHFVADLHQPLHVAYAEDRGGNSIDVRVNGQSGNLHGAWDSDLPRALSLTSRNAAARLLSGVSRKDAQRWRDPEVSNWANESFQLARDVVYPQAKDGVLTDAEVKSARPTVELQLRRAAVRLAWLLDEAAAGRIVLKSMW